VALGEIAARALAIEVRRTLVAGAMSGGAGEAPPQVGAVWLTGAGASDDLALDLSAALDGVARDGADGSPASPAAGPVRVKLLPREDGRFAFLPGGESLAPEFDLALGLALLGLRPASERLDLARLVRPVPAEGSAGRARRVPVLAGVGAAGVAAALLLFALPGAGDRELAAAAQRARSDARQLAARRQQMEERVRVLHGAVVPQHSYLDVLNDVSALAGPDVWLTQFTYDRGRPIVIRGAARSSAAVAGLVEGLRNSRHLERVTLGAVTQSAEEKRYVQFTVTGALSGDAPLQARRRGTRATPVRASGSGEGA
jgi:Tfp pilus assembly protein PilN